MDRMDVSIQQGTLVRDLMCMQRWYHVALLCVGMIQKLSLVMVDGLDGLVEHKYKSNSMKRVECELNEIVSEVYELILFRRIPNYVLPTRSNIWSESNLTAGKCEGPYRFDTIFTVIY
jgi:hypothetical protein